MFMSDIKNIAILKHWSYRHGILQGAVVGHPTYTDGTLITAGPVEDVIKDAEDTYIVETATMFYALVPPADEDRPFNFTRKTE